MENKEFFTKFIPVDEEIKEGDLSIDSRGRILPVDSGRLAMLNHNYVPESFKKSIRKVKLFLCSKDIQIGDIAFIPNPEESGKVLNEHDLLFYWKYRGAYKIIGEISPNAIWLTENQTLYENNARFVHKSKISEPKQVMWEIKSVAENMRKDFYVAVQCPTCKQFH